MNALLFWLRHASAFLTAFVAVALILGEPADDFATLTGAMAVKGAGFGLLYVTFRLLAWRRKPEDRSDEMK